MKTLMYPHFGTAKVSPVPAKVSDTLGLPARRCHDRVLGVMRFWSSLKATTPSANKPDKRPFLKRILVLSGIVLCNVAVAATPPDAGSLLKDMGGDRSLQLPSRSEPEQSPPAPEVPADEGAKVTIKAFRFVGNTLLSGDELALTTKGYLDHPIGFNKLQQAVSAVAKAYRDAGWVVKAFLPKQDVTEGVVTIRIIEAVYAGARLQGEATARIEESRLLSYFDARQQTGDYLNTTTLDRALLLADDLPGVTVTGSLSKGKEVGETELLVRAVDEPRYSGQLLLDNSGARATGDARGIASLKINSPSRRGDQIGGDVIHSEGSDYLRLNYSLPVGNDGWQFNIEGAYLKYELIAPEFKALQGEGDSTSIALGLTYPLLRSRLRNVYLDLGYSGNAFHNEASSTTQSDYRVDTLNMGLAANLFDDFGGGGSSYLSLDMVAGHLNQKTLDLGEDPKLEGAFGKITYGISRQQALGDRLSLYASLRGQLSNDKLDSSQRFYLGGPNGVRAYPVNEGSGSRGQLANVELRWGLPHNLTFSGFYDWGHVGNRNDSPSYDLKGFGVGLAWRAPHDLTLQATLARRDGSNPNPTSTGKDQDGSLDRDRLWLTLSFRF